VVRRECKETNDTRKCSDVLNWCWELRNRRHRIWRIAEKDTLQKNRWKGKQKRVFNIKEWATFNITESVLSDGRIRNAPGTQCDVPRTLSTDFCNLATLSLQATMIGTPTFIISSLNNNLSNVRHKFLIWGKTMLTNMRAYCRIWGFHGGDYEEWCLLGCYAVWLL
jgi:hypothetical protein